MVEGQSQQQQEEEKAQRKGKQAVPDIQALIQQAVQTALQEQSSSLLTQIRQEQEQALQGFSKALQEAVLTRVRQEQEQFVQSLAERLQPVLGGNNATQQSNGVAAYAPLLAPLLQGFGDRMARSMLGSGGGAGDSMVQLTQFAQQVGTLVQALLAPISNIYNMGRSAVLQELTTYARLAGTPAEDVLRKATQPADIDALALERAKSIAMQQARQEGKERE